MHIERDLKYIDAAFEKMKSDITNNITDIDQQKFCPIFQTCVDHLTTI